MVWIGYGDGLEIHCSDQDPETCKRSIRRSIQPKEAHQVFHDWRSRRPVGRREDCDVELHRQWSQDSSIPSESEEGSAEQADSILLGGQRKGLRCEDWSDAD